MGREISSSKGKKLEFSSILFHFLFFIVCFVCSFLFVLFSSFLKFVSSYGYTYVLCCRHCMRTTLDGRHSYASPLQSCRQVKQWPGGRTPSAVTTTGRSCSRVSTRAPSTTSVSSFRARRRSSRAIQLPTRARRKSARVGPPARSPLLANKSPSTRRRSPSWHRSAAVGSSGCTTLS